MAYLSSFEVLAETLVPAGILPPKAANPFLIQGYWVQISLPEISSVQSTQFNVIFEETTDFTQGLGQGSLQAQVVGATGEVNIYPDFFASTGRGFLGQQITAGKTLIYGIQCVPGLAERAIPQNGTGWRGTVQVNAQDPGTLIATPTQRLVYYQDPDIATSPVVDGVVYSLPTFSGNVQI